MRTFDVRFHFQVKMKKKKKILNNIRLLTNSAFMLKGFGGI